MKRLFVLSVKYIPTIQLVGMLINNTLYTFDILLPITYLLDFLIGGSLVYIILGYICSITFGFCNAKHNQDAFDLYKYSRDSKDELAGEIGALRTEVAVLKATRPYQDKLIQCDIQRVADHADFNLWRRTCRMISGEVVLPNTPVVTGYGSYNPCACTSTATTPAAQ